VQPIYGIHTLSDIVRQQALFEEKLKTQIATGAAVVAVLLAAFGVYGILSYSVSQRRREIGIRIAVGATNGRIFGLIVREGLMLSVAGTALGMLLASAIASANAQAMAPADPRDPLVYAIAAVVLVAVTLLSCYFPARRATRVDPNVCLRSE
jgi:ABC-type antimicrobial peptide transport system permease subunit